MTAHNDDSTDKTQALDDRVNNRSHRPNSQAFRDFVAEGWDRTPLDAQALAAAGFTPARRAK
ncbi:MAG: aminopeptidase P family protein, partial [Brevibacterium aurantiacum]|nr:aminopeptidase P family protein [Brevibacterium aurantiacum]